MGRNNFCGTFVFLGVASYLNSTIIKGIHARQRRDIFPPAKRNATDLITELNIFNFVSLFIYFAFPNCLSGILD